MDLKKKVTAALQGSLNPDFIHLEDNDGISGFVVSAKFRRMEPLDRQKLIEDAFRQSSISFRKEELRHVLAIAALTPIEYEALGLKEKGNHR